jgi:dihydroflavonol-4-reductase
LKPTLVTGASGFLGWHIARLLAERGHHVKALVRSEARLKEIEAESVSGDLRDRASLERAVAGCGVVFHVAADYRLWTRDPNGMYQSNVEGTRNLLEAARSGGVERVVYTSTVGCIGIPRGGIGDENSPVGLADMTGPYKRTKFLAEQVALDFARESFPVVIVNPTAPVGDHDWKPTPTGKMIVDFLAGKMPAFLDTGLNIVDAADTALGHVLALERGRPGERYILGCRNMTLQQIFEELARISGRPAPRVRIPYAVAYAAGVATTAWASITGQEPRAPLDAVRMARKKMWVSTAKAERDLGFQPGPAEQALGKAARWFVENGYVA